MTWLSPAVKKHIYIMMTRQKKKKNAYSVALNAIVNTTNDL